jgi:di/tricarboxylate transporter
MMARGRERALSPSKRLLPLSFASILGGSCTLIGTSTNLVASAVGERFGLPLNVLHWLLASALIPIFWPLV